MISKSKLAIVAAVVAMGIASPAFAKSTVHQSGLGAYAMVPDDYNSDGFYSGSSYSGSIETQR
jgi:hypothetical protein